MSGLNKKNWKRVTFGEVCKNLNLTERDPLGSGIERYVGLEHIESGNLHINTWGNVADGTTFTKKFKAGNVLFGKRRAYLKKAALADFDGICSGDILVLEANEKLIDPKLLPFLVSSDGFFDHAVQTSAGSLSPRTKFQDLANYEFSVPPKKEQAKLAELLWAGDEVVERYGSLKDKIKSAKDYYLADIFNSRKCISTTIGEIAICLDNRRIPIKSSDRSPGIVPYYGASGIVDYVDTHIYDEPILLVSEDGENLNTRNLPIAYEVDGKCWVNNHAHVLSVKKGSRYLLAEYFNHTNISDFVSGSTRPKLNKSTLMEMPLEIPEITFHPILEVKLRGINDSMNSCDEHKQLTEQIQKQLINQIFS